MKAYKCDRCRKLFEGDASLRVRAYGPGIADSGEEKHFCGRCKTIFERWLEGSLIDDPMAKSDLGKRLADIHDYCSKGGAVSWAGGMVDQLMRDLCVGEYAVWEKPT